MTRRTLRPPGLYPGAPYAYGVVAEAGSLVLTAGACPLDEQGVVVAPGDPAAQAAQAAQAVANLFATLADAGVGPDAVVKTTVYVATTEHADLLTVWEVVRDAFGRHDPPSTLLGVTVLGYTGQLVEIEATAIAPGPAGAAP
jgi:enamine deaminase RidA (YjgF/YER057c/UK114 family)